MDSRLFGSTKVGDSVFRNALVMFESVLDKATEKYPQQTLRISFDTHANKKSGNATTQVFVEAVPTDTNNTITEKNNLDEFFQTEAEDSVLDSFDKISLFQLETQSLVNGELVEGPLKMDKPSKDHWQVRYRINEPKLDNAQIKTRFTAMRKRQADVYTPNAKKNPILEKFKSMSEEVLKQEKLGK